MDSTPSVREEYSIPSRTLSLLQREEDDDHVVATQCASPRLSRANSTNMNTASELTLPCWSHASSCECIECRDVCTHQLFMTCLCIKALHEQMISNVHGETGKVERRSTLYDGQDPKLYWHTLLNHFDAVTGRVLMMLNDVTVRFLHYSAKELVIRPSIYQSTLTRCCVDLVDYAVRSRNSALYKEWCSKSIELLDFDLYPWMSECAQHRARLHLLQAQYQLNLLTREPVKSPDTIVAAVAHKLTLLSIGKKSADDTKLSYKTPGYVLIIVGLFFRQFYFSFTDVLNNSMFWENIIF